MIYSENEAVFMAGWYASKEEARQRRNKNQQPRMVVQAMVISARTNSFKKRRFRRVYPLTLLGGQADIAICRSMVVSCASRLDDASQSLLPQGYSGRSHSCNHYHEKHVIQDMLVPLYKVPDALEFSHREIELYPIWLCPHKLYKIPYKTMICPEPGFEKHHRKGDTPYAQMFPDVGLYYTPNPIFCSEEFDGVEVCRKIEQRLIQNHGFQALYSVTELNEKYFWRMFDAGLYRQSREK